MADIEMASSQFQKSELPLAGKAVFGLTPLPPFEVADWFPLTGSSRKS